MERKASTAQQQILVQLLDDDTLDPKALPLSLLEDITGGFADDQVIGRGGYADVYKGILGDRAVAVKRLSHAFMDDTAFNREVECLMQAKHKNIARFLGYCADTQGSVETFQGKHVMADVCQRLLCFEYVPNGTLDKFIIDPNREWEVCYKIIKGICEGLQNLHDKNVIHLDLKPVNILLDDNMTPKITDFGLSRRFDENQSRHITKNIAGTMGYWAPEYCLQGVIARSADIFSLGAIIMELLSGRTGDVDIVDVQKSWRDRLGRSKQDAREQFRICYETASKCIDLNPQNRPGSVRDIIDMLHGTESIKEIPDAGEGSSLSEVAQLNTPKCSTAHRRSNPAMVLQSGLGQAATTVFADVGRLISMIKQAVLMAQTNKEGCAKLAHRVSILEGLLPHVHTPDAVWQLARLRDTLRDAHELVMSCQESSTVLRLVMAGSQAERFRDVQSRIDSYIITLQEKMHLVTNSPMTKFEQVMGKPSFINQSGCVS